MEEGKPSEKIVGRGRIVEGAGIMQDFHFGRWPQCFPPIDEYGRTDYQCIAKNPDMIFDVEWTGTYWRCKADGYGYIRSKGERGSYGNGCIFVDRFDGVVLIPPSDYSI